MQQAEHLIEIVVEQGKIHVAHGGAAFIGEGFHVVGQQTFHQSHLNLVVRDVERVDARGAVVGLDGDVATLIEQGEYALHVFCGGIESRG